MTYSHAHLCTACQKPQGHVKGEIFCQFNALVPNLMCNLEVIRSNFTERRFFSMKFDKYADEQTVSKLTKTQNSSSPET